MGLPSIPKGSLAVADGLLTVRRHKRQPAVEKGTEYPLDSSLFEKSAQAFSNPSDEASEGPKPLGIRVSA